MRTLVKQLGDRKEVEIIQHANGWNTKKYYSGYDYQGHVVAPELVWKVHRVPREISFQSKLLNDFNQYFAWGLYRDDETLIDRIIEGLKPAGARYWETEDMKELEDFFATRLQLEEDDAVDFVDWEDGRHHRIFAAQRATLDDLFDLDSICQDYIRYGVFASKEDFFAMEDRWAGKNLIEFHDNYDTAHKGKDLDTAPGSS